MNKGEIERNETRMCKNDIVECALTDTAFF
jgi:hypothetical protein